MDNLDTNKIRAYEDKLRKDFQLLIDKELSNVFDTLKQLGKIPFLWKSEIIYKQGKLEEGSEKQICELLSNFFTNKKKLYELNKEHDILQYQQLNLESAHKYNYLIPTQITKMVQEYPDIEIKYTELYEHLNSLCKVNFNEEIKNKLEETINKKSFIENTIKDLDLLLSEYDKQIKELLVNNI